MIHTNRMNQSKHVLSINEKHLLLVPRRNEDRLWKTDDNGLVEILVPRDNLLDNLVRRFRKTPEAMRIHLDPQGSFVWKAIDGQRNILSIGMLLENEFGERAKPLYSRLLHYLRIMRNNRFITLGRASQNND